MQDRGILQQIRDLLAQGKLTGEVITLGYAPGSVYRARRQLLRQQPAIEARRSPMQPILETQQVRADEPPLNPHGRGQQESGLAKALEHAQQALTQAQEKVTVLEAEREELQELVSDLERERDDLQAQAHELGLRLSASFEACPNCGASKQHHYQCGNAWICPPPGCTLRTQAANEGMECSGWRLPLSLS